MTTVSVLKIIIIFGIIGGLTEIFLEGRKKARLEKLYEQSLPRVRQPIVFPELPLLQYRCRVKCPKEMSMLGADHSREYAINKMTKDFRDIIDQQITYNDNEGYYEMTVWVRDKNKS